MTHVPKEKRLKWDQKAVKHYLMGYADNVKGYRLYNPLSKKVITSRDVTIIEPDDNSEMMRAVVNEHQELSPSPKEQLEESNNSDFENSTSTVITQNDSTFVEEDNSSTSHDFFESIPEEVDITQNIELKRQDRTRKEPDRYGFGNVCVEADLNLYGDQITQEEVLNGPESQEWHKEMKEELKSFQENDAWCVCDKPDQATVVKCKWVYKKKTR